MKFSTDRDQIGLTALMVISILIMAGALVIIILPKPTTATIQNAYRLKANKANQATQLALNRIGDYQAKIRTETWPSGAKIAPTASQMVNAIAKQHNVSITAFRPQRFVNTGDLIQVPFTINVQGNYPDVAAMEADIERNPKNMLAVETILLTSSEESSSKVTATIQVEAYLESRHGASSATAGTTSTKTLQDAIHVKT